MNNTHTIFVSLVDVVVFVADVVFVVVFVADVVVIVVVDVDGPLVKNSFEKSYLLLTSQT